MADGIILIHAATKEACGRDQPTRWEVLGNTLLSPEQGPDRNQHQPCSGLFIDRWMEYGSITGLLLSAWEQTANRPMLALVYGDGVPHGYAERLQTLAAHQVEVVRLFLFPGGERGVLGGSPDGIWLNRLRRHLADQGVISLVCRPVEADEIVASYRQYRSFKQQFYLDLAERCERLGARANIVAQGIGMDRRVGQGWFLSACREASAQVRRRIEQWLIRQWHDVREKGRVFRVAIWGELRMFPRFSGGLEEAERVSLFLPAIEEKTNIPYAGRWADHWQPANDPADALDQADALFILEADRRVREFPLDLLVRRMRSPVVVDICSCFPVQEAEAYGIRYRTFGQNTNVWNGSDYNRV